MRPIALAAALIAAVALAPLSAAQDTPPRPAESPGTPAPASTPAPLPASGDSSGDSQPPAESPQPADARRPLTLGKETVTGGRLSDTDERRYSTATKMVFGREELERYGDTNLADVLKRLPGITISGAPGRGGDIRMRGLGRGYTLILLNGEPIPRGFSLDTLSPDQVERIEVLRAPVAENTVRAIAGTINIILRDQVAKRENEIVPTLGVRSGRLQSYLSAQRNDVIDKFSYNVTANVGHSDATHESTTDTVALDTTSGIPTLVQQQRNRIASTSDNFQLNSRLNWKLDGGDSLVLTPFAFATRTRGNTQSVLDQTRGELPPPYATSTAQSTSEITAGRLFGNWRLRLDDGARLELKFNAGTSHSSVQSDTTQREAGGGLAHTLRNDTSIRDLSFSTSGKYSRPIAAAHQFGAGWEVEGGRRDERASDVLDGVDPLAQFGDIEATTRRAALYVQDEWNVTPLWAMYGGLRTETLETRSTSAIDAVANRGTVTSPLFHSIWRFDPESKDQVRLALTRTYRAPTLGNLTAVPTLSTSYPASGPNTPTNADAVGNPTLKPELAWGLDVAFEHYFEGGGLVSASIFRRSIDDLIRNVTALETVSWSPVQRWVSRPRNIGHAASQGIELEAKFRLDELVTDWPRVNFRANYSRYWSSVDDVPGPNNRLDQQPTWTANVGADYRLTSLPLSFGGNLTLTPSFTVQQAVGQEYSQGWKRGADIYALWRFDAAMQLRLSAANLYAADYRTATREVFDTTDQRAESAARTYRWFGARLEIKF